MAVLMINTIPDGVKKAFKDACVKDGRSMAKVVVELMVEFAKEVQIKEQVKEENTWLGSDESGEL